MIFAFVFLLLIVGTILFIKIRDNNRFDNFVTQLEQKQGLVIIKKWKEGGLYYISGFRDGSLRYFGKDAILNGIDSNKVRYSWETFVSNEPQFILQRFKQVFDKKEDIDISIVNGVLKVRGTVSENLQKKVKAYFTMHPEVGKVDMSKLFIRDTINLLDLKVRIENISLYFDR